MSANPEENGVNLDAEIVIGVLRNQVQELLWKSTLLEARAVQAERHADNLLEALKNRGGEEATTA